MQKYCVDHLDIHLARIRKKVRDNTPPPDVVSVYHCATCRHKHDCLEWSKHTYEPQPKNLEELERLWA
jgi:hypothetical protein